VHLPHRKGNRGCQLPRYGSDGVSPPPGALRLTSSETGLPFPPDMYRIYDFHSKQGPPLENQSAVQYRTGADGKIHVYTRQQTTAQETSEAGAGELSTGATGLWHVHARTGVDIPR
jgi:hypothetical protein